MIHIIYIDDDFKCHTVEEDGFMPIEAGFFDGKCNTFINGYRFIPAGKTWTREDGVVFKGEMTTPWKPYSELAAAQAEYEKAQLELADMRAALELLGVSV